MKKTRMAMPRPILGRFAETKGLRITGAKPREMLKGKGSLDGCLFRDNLSEGFPIRGRAMGERSSLFLYDLYFGLFQHILTSPKGLEVFFDCRVWIATIEYKNGHQNLQPIPFPLSQCMGSGLVVQQRMGTH